MEKVSKSLIETEQIASECLEWLAKEKRPVGKAAVVGLAGDLGAGKTTFTQAMARALGIREPVTSPTFVIMKSYKCQWQGSPLPFGNLIHIDCYRLDGPHDLLHLGWNELAVDLENLILVEWPERVAPLLSTPTLKINFEVAGENSRKIIYG